MSSSAPVLNGAFLVGIVDEPETSILGLLWDFLVGRSRTFFGLQPDPDSQHWVFVSYVYRINNNSYLFSPFFVIGQTQDSDREPDFIIMDPYPQPYHKSKLVILSLQSLERFIHFSLQNEILFKMSQVLPVWYRIDLFRIRIQLRLFRVPNPTNFI